MCVHVKIQIPVTVNSKKEKKLVLNFEWMDGKIGVEGKLKERKVLPPFSNRLSLMFSVLCDCDSNSN